MKQVNIYLETSFRGLKKQDGVIGYVIEYITAKGPATYNKITEIQNATPNFAELFALTEAMGHLSFPVEIKIFTDSKYLKQGIEAWMEIWEKNNWQNAKGKEVANRTDWELLKDQLKPHIYSIELGIEHGYKKWLKMEIETKLKEANHGKRSGM